MAKVFVLRESFLDRVRKMSGLKSEQAFAGALHVSLEELKTAERLRRSWWRDVIQIHCQPL